MADRRGLEAELSRLAQTEFETPPPPGVLREKKKKPPPKGGPPGQLGKVAPAATGLYEPPEEAPPKKQPSRK